MRRFIAAALATAALASCVAPGGPGEDSGGESATDTKPDTADPPDSGDSGDSGEVGDPDGDGFTRAQGDCDESDASVGPGATELPGDGIDQDCDGSDEAVAGAQDVGTRLPGTVDGGWQGWATQFATSDDASGVALLVAQATAGIEEGSPEAASHVGVYRDSDLVADEPPATVVSADWTRQLGTGIAAVRVDDAPGWLLLNHGVEDIYYGVWPDDCRGDCGISAAAVTRPVDGSGSGYGYGFSAEAQTDLDGDGNEDLVMASLYNSYSGANAWLEVLAGPLTAEQVASEEPTRITSGNTSWITPVAGGADLTGDGYADLLATENEYGASAEGAGRVYLLAGGAGLVSDLAEGYAVIDGTVAHGNLGRGLAAGDIDADGVADACMSVPLDATVAERSGLVGCLLGPITPGGHAADELLATSTGEAAGAYYGQSLEAIDLDSDGDAELAVAAVNEAATDGTGGLVYLLDFADPGSGLASSVVKVIGGSNAGDGFGYSMSSGDLDGDGRDDLAVGAPFAVVDGQEVGAAWYFAGDGGAW